MNSGKVVTYQMLLEKIWGPYVSENNKILRVNMTNIRRKIGDDPADPKISFLRNPELVTGWQNRKTEQYAPRV